MGGCACVLLCLGLWFCVCVSVCVRARVLTLRRVRSLPASASDVWALLGERMRDMANRHRDRKEGAGGRGVESAREI